MRFKIKNLLIIILICNFSTISKSANEDDIYKKIDLFSEVLDKIKEFLIPYFNRKGGNIDLK